MFIVHLNSLKCDNPFRIIRRSANTTAISSAAVERLYGARFVDVAISSLAYAAKFSKIGH